MDKDHIEKQETIASAFFKIATSVRLTLKFWAFLSGIIGILVCTILVFDYCFRHYLQGVEVILSEHGATTIKWGNKRTFQWLLSPAQVWAPSDITVHEGDRITFHASGSANLAIHHLVSDAQSHKRPHLLWTGPDGISEKGEDWSRLRPVDRYRIPYRLVPDLDFGSVLVQVSAQKGTPPSHPTSGRVFSVGSTKEVCIDKGLGGRLFFAVNEILLDETMHNVYVINEEIDRKYLKKHPAEQLEKEWEEIKANRYWTPWFDDNVGSFLITAEIVPGSLPCSPNRSPDRP